MSLEDKISKLQRELALKNAFLAVSISFGKGNKFPADVQEQIVNELKDFCTKRAENLDAVIDVESEQKLSAEDVEILKMLADKVRNKTTTAAASAPQQAPVKKQPTSNKAVFAPADESTSSADGPILGRKATLLSTESLHPSQRAKAHSGMEVFVNAVRPDGFVNLRTKEGYQFNVPLDDVEVAQ